MSHRRAIYTMLAMCIAGLLVGFGVYVLLWGTFFNAVN